MNKVTIIGGSGFIGTRLCTRISRRNDLNFSIVDVEQSITFPHATILADVRDLNSLRTAITDDSTIINLAAAHKDNERPIRRYHDVNVEGAKNICTVANERGVRAIIFTSTVAVYGFAPIGTDESGQTNPFNEYGRTKSEAEKVFCDWQKQKPTERSLVIVRPTVVFGEQNRGNVYNLLSQIASGRFAMIGNGFNVKSMAYVENVAAFLEHSLKFGPGVHLFNYVDKPDFEMNQLVSIVKRSMGRDPKISLRIPYPLGLAAGHFLDALSKLTGKQFPLSKVRVQKFCANTMFHTKAHDGDFKAPISLQEALENTIKYEFREHHETAQRFYTE
jgi:nucleoside-diphosphate-sugar epimerase